MIRMGNTELSGGHCSLAVFRAPDEASPRCD